jgi:hypothetical protein
MRRKRIIHLNRDKEDDNEISGNKTSSFEEKKKSSVNCSEEENNNDNPKNIIVFNRNKDKDKDFISKHSSNLVLDMLDTPLSIHNNKSRIVHSKFENPHNKNKNEREIIFEKNEKEEDYTINKYKHKNKKEDNYEKFNTETKKKRYIRGKSVKNVLNFKRISKIASNDSFLSDDDNHCDNGKNLKNYLSFNRKKKNKNVKIQLGKMNKKEHFKKGILKRNATSKSVILTTGYTEENKKTESNLKENKIKDNKKLGNMKLHNKKVNFALTNDDYNNMNYEMALHNDNRTFLKTFISILIEEHIILNTFCTDLYLELRSIKISFLIFSIEISFFLNAFFYTDQYISDTYHNNGVLDFFSSLPKSIYSFCVTIILVNLLKILSTSKKQLMNIIKTVNDKQEYLLLMEKEIKKLRNKLIIYFSIIFLLGTFFLYYCAAFCAVYTNSQLFWFYGCLESLALDLSTPFLISLVLAIFRNIGLRKHIKCLYLTSYYLGYLF